MPLRLFSLIVALLCLFPIFIVLDIRRATLRTLSPSMYFGLTLLLTSLSRHSSDE